MTLTIDSQIITTVISNSQNDVQNEFINRQRNLTGVLIAQKLVAVDKRDEIITLQNVSTANLNFLRARNGLDLTCSLAGVGDHNFSGVYNLAMPDSTDKSYNDTQNFTITLHRV